MIVIKNKLILNNEDLKKNLYMYFHLMVVSSFPLDNDTAILLFFMTHLVLFKSIHFCYK